MAEIPLAVAASVKSPGLFLLVDLLAGQSSPGSATKKALMIADKSSAGTITADTELVEAIAGEAAAETLLGPGMPGALAAKALFEEYGLADVDLVCPLESIGVAASGTVTFASGPPTVSWTVNVYIAGYLVQIVWAAGQTDTQGGDTLEAAINADTNLPVTAANVAGVVTLTAKSKGTWGNDIKLRVTTADGTTGTVTASGANLASGTVEFDIDNVLTLVTGREYDLICLVTSNADSQDGTATSNPGKLKTHIDSLDQGQQAKLQQMVIGSTGTLAAIKAGVDSLNFGRGECIHMDNGLALPGILAGAETGARLREESRDLAANRIHIEYESEWPTVLDYNADALTAAEVEDALNNGVTPVSFTFTGDARPERPITMYHLDAGGNADDRLLDTSRVTGTDGVAKDLRVALPREFKGAKLSEDLEDLGDELPPNTVEVRDVKAFVDGRVRFFVSLGVVKGLDYQEAVDNGTFIVRVNPSDSSQCDIVLPIKIVPPLAKFSLAVLHVGP
jgi:phage tail sheath gpL-like